MSEFSTPHISWTGRVFSLLLAALALWESVSEVRQSMTVLKGCVSEA